MALLTDSIGETLSMVGELLRGVPPESLLRAKAAAVRVEQVINGLKRDYPNDPVVLLGVAFAIFKIAELLIEANRDAEKKGAGLIQLLS